jgi:hypothetical protein
VLADQVDGNPADGISVRTWLVNASLVVGPPGDDDVSKLFCWHTEFLEGRLDKVDVLMKDLVIRLVFVVI